MTRRTARIGPALAVLALLVMAAARILVARPLGGPLQIEWPEGIIMDLRLRALAAGAIVGTALATSGVLLQAVLRNPLASPSILGVSAGAALGVMAALALGHHLGASLVGADGGMVPACLGGGTVLVIVFGLGRVRGWLDPLGVLLVGVVVSSICGGLILLLQHLVPHGLRGDLVAWMAGSIRQGTETRALVTAGGIALVGAAWTALRGPALDALAFSDDEARAVGVQVGRVRTAAFLFAGVLAAAAVAIAGPIAFVGLLAPHLARMIVGERQRALAVMSVVLGAAVVVGADVLAQCMSTEVGRMPAGVCTALLGGPLFIWLLRRSRRELVS